MVNIICRQRCCRWSIVISLYLVFPKGTKIQDFLQSFLIILYNNNSLRQVTQTLFFLAKKTFGDRLCQFRNYP
ncbi:hypothetical protein DERP_009932 [Dermatophagoides pteronyssinus]|uniref:Uncharacterized protein n=1 Tax=Dermatophagoides pteronyssinus TaxID=6956 RepID=A0ABQ8J1X6_DERPT|nr:hypothetical protein DERP_009932 [Dermatophagoides pteronyssinus]